MTNTDERLRDLRQMIVEGTKLSSAEKTDICRLIEAARSTVSRSGASSISPQDPQFILAGIKQFGLASDGSDLRDLEAAIERLSPPLPDDKWDAASVLQDQAKTLLARATDLKREAYQEDVAAGNIGADYLGERAAFSNEWLREKIESDADVETEAGIPPLSLPSTSEVADKLVIDIACQFGGPGVAREAYSETTATGVRWTISGDLAKAIYRALSAAPSPITAEAIVPSVFKTEPVVSRPDPILNGDRVSQATDEPAWIPWSGGECPVEPETMVEVMLMGVEEIQRNRGNRWFWGRFKTGKTVTFDIVAYRLATPVQESGE